MLLRPTIKDVAQKAGVANSTVSYYLNGTKNLKPETIEKIKNAIEELSYIPRVAARSLKTKQTRTIGVIVPDIKNSFFTEIICGIEDIAFANGFSVILCNTREDNDKEQQYLNILISKDIDGLIYISTSNDMNILDNLDNFPIVMVDRKVSKAVSTVCGNSILGGYLATKHLLEKYGFPVYLITGTLEVSTYRERMLGYINALREFGFRYDESFVYQGNISFESGVELTTRLINSGCSVRSVFATNDILALGALKVFSKEGYTPGKDVFLVGYDDSELNTVLSPALSSVCQPKYEMGVASAGLLIRQITEKQKITELIIMDPQLIIRGTS